MRCVFAGAMILCLAAAGFWSSSRLSHGSGATLPDDPIAAAHLVEEYRAQGPAGLRRLLTQYDASHDPKLLPILDKVAGQRGAAVSRLYWYTDLDQARAAATAERKPILYLRLLGKLTDEYSCANSRFFRTVLYSNATVSKYLRERYVLVWVSEPPGSRHHGRLWRRSGTEAHHHRQQHPLHPYVAGAGDRRTSRPLRSHDVSNRLITTQCRIR